MRAGYLDALRGVAVVWMIIFHACYDLRLFGYINWDFGSGFWYAFPRVIAFTFLFCVGISLTYVHRPNIQWKKLNKRLLILGIAAGMISLVTYIIYPAQWIFFGTLHCIFAGSLFGAMVVNYPKLIWTLFITIIVSQYVLNFDIKWISNILEKPSMDFIPIYPWFWAILLGIILAPHLSRNSALQNMKSPRFLTLLGQHSLKIYLLHQPLLFGLLYLYSKLSRYP